MSLISRRFRIACCIYDAKKSIRLPLCHQRLWRVFGKAQVTEGYDEKTPSTTSPSGIRHLLLVEQSRLCTLRNIYYMENWNWWSPTNFIPRHIQEYSRRLLLQLQVGSDWRNGEIHLSQQQFNWILVPSEKYKKMCLHEIWNISLGEVSPQHHQNKFQRSMVILRRSFRRKLEWSQLISTDFFWEGWVKAVANPDKGPILMHCCNCGSPIWWWGRHPAWS